MKQIFYNIAISALLSFGIAGVLVLAPTTPVHALDCKGTEVSQDLCNNFSASSKGFAGLKIGGSVEEIVGNVVLVILSVMGLVFLILMIYAGITWMTAEGDQTKISKARGTIFHAVIGLILVLSAYAITAFVLTRLVGSIAPV